MLERSQLAKSVFSEESKGLMNPTKHFSGCCFKELPSLKNKLSVLFDGTIIHRIIREHRTSSS